MPPDSDSQPLAPLRRPKFVAFVSDPASAATLNTALAATFPQGANVHTVGFRSTLSILARMISPEILLVDLSGEDQPLGAMNDLAEVVEPGTTVIVIGQDRALSFYRSVVNGMGAREYLAKPLTVEIIRHHILPFINANPQADEPRRGGKLIAVSGTRGGVGATAVAANLAYVIGCVMHRHTMLLDTDLQTGTAAFTLNLDPGGRGLSAALAAPQRIDQMLIERVAQPAGDRLHVMSVQESLTAELEHSPASAATLAKTLRGRYNFIIADTGAKFLPFARDILAIAHQHVIVLDPSIGSIRNLAAFNHLARGPRDAARTLLVLNQAGRPHGLSQAVMEHAIGVTFDAVIPDLPRVIPKADKYGDIAAEIRGPFRAALLTLAGALGAEAVSKPVPKPTETAA